MRHLFGAWGVLVVLVVSQSAHGQNRGTFRPPSAPAMKCCYNGRTVVLVAGGTCDCVDAKERLDIAAECMSSPPMIKDVDWVTVDGSIACYRSQNAQLAGACKMVREVQLIRQCSPNSAIILVGYCAGARVVLLAAEQLPPCSVDRIILLSPSVASCYDPRRALRASRCGIDMFYDSEDTILEVKESEFGTCDGLKCSTAGRMSFLITKNRMAAADPTLAALRQYDLAKCPELNGGLYPTLGKTFLCRYVMPLLTACGTYTPAPAPQPPSPPPAPPYAPPLPPPGPGYGPPSTLPPFTPSPSTQPRLPPAPRTLPPPSLRVEPAAPPILPPPVVQPPR